MYERRRHVRVTSENDMQTVITQRNTLYTHIFECITELMIQDIRAHLNNLGK